MYRYGRPFLAAVWSRARSSAGIRIETMGAAAFFFEALVRASNFSLVKTCASPFLAAARNSSAWALRFLYHQSASAASVANFGRRAPCVYWLFGVVWMASSLESLQSSRNDHLSAAGAGVWHASPCALEGERGQRFATLRLCGGVEQGRGGGQNGRVRSRVHYLGRRAFPGVRGLGAGE